MKNLVGFLFFPFFFFFSPECTMLLQRDALTKTFHFSFSFLSLLQVLVLQCFLVLLGVLGGVFWGGWVFWFFFLLPWILLRWEHFLHNSAHT